jgi:hypothetical protein
MNIYQYYGTSGAGRVILANRADIIIANKINRL